MKKLLVLVGAAGAVAAVLRRRKGQGPSDVWRNATD
ncbi:MAG: hypothetical protein JWN61_551 [Pseudonocardiales bacterium]|nr:hypothetical protein [Jatrophihabitantaceae bacterium]MCW2602416.1 hypothetical protein [Pseudonocardiales bacterium]